MTTLYVVGYIVAGLIVWPILARTIEARSFSQSEWIDYAGISFVALICAAFWPLVAVFFLFYSVVPWLFFPELRNKRWP